MAKRCFVISPIGVPGSEIREHADEVFRFIIEPAMKELGIFAYRADHVQQIGRITDQMYHSILEDDLCIAVLTYHNPNVFYELAIALSAARPVLILILKGQTIPFDIRDMRAIEYDLRPTPLFEGVYVKQIVEHVRNLELIDWQVSVPFGDQLSPLGRKIDQMKLHDKVENYGTTDRWLDLLVEAKTAIDLSGISLTWWIKRPAFRTILLQKAAQGCKVRVLLMHPENVALSQTINPAVKFNYEHLAAEIVAARNFFAELSREQPNVQFRQVRVGCFHQHVVRNDDLMTVAFLTYSEATAQAPLGECSSRSPLYRAMVHEFDVLWNLNAPVPAQEGAGK